MPCDIWWHQDKAAEMLAQDNTRLRDWQNGVTEREAACCPEDVGFDEYIGTLTKRITTVENATTALAKESRQGGGLILVPIAAWEKFEKVVNGKP